MKDAKYIGRDVHQATISVAILDSAGKLVMEAILETTPYDCSDRLWFPHPDRHASLRPGMSKGLQARLVQNVPVVGNVEVFPSSLVSELS